MVESFVLSGLLLVPLGQMNGKTVRVTGEKTLIAVTFMLQHIPLYKHTMYILYIRRQKDIFWGKGVRG